MKNKKKIIYPENPPEPIEFKPRVTLKDIRYTWNSGELRKDGERRTEAQCVTSLQNKHVQMGGTRPLTPTELHAIIYKDRSMFKQKVNSETTAQLQIKRLEAQTRQLELRKLKIEHDREVLRLQTNAHILKQEVQKLMNESTPEQYGLELYQRLGTDYVTLAVLSQHPNFSEKDAKLIVGSWVRRGL